MEDAAGARWEETCRERGGTTSGADERRGDSEGDAGGDPQRSAMARTKANNRTNASHRTGATAPSVDVHGLAWSVDRSSG
ncbi:MAG: hypothetical protein LW806_09375 [Planctomycetaceae bacterium]|nr:hypothetical protein [Planctomycetaceae bacterium]